MEIKYVDPMKMKSLEDYVISLVYGMITLKTLSQFHIQALNLGVMKEDHDCRANTMIWDCTRLLRLYHDQAESLLELLPEGINFNEIINKLQLEEIKKAKQITKKPKKKKNELC